MSAEQRYYSAAHAMQSGVAMEMNCPGPWHATEPKRLRVGVNTAMADLGSLARLLINKGLISETEYFEALADGMEREKANYETRLTRFFGKPITLA